MNILIFIIFYILTALTVVGYGQLANNIIFTKQKNINEIGFIGLFGFLFLYYISSLIIFFSNINTVVSSIIFLIGIILFLIFVFYKQFNTNNLLLLFSVLIIFAPLAIIAEQNEDFFFYYQPYMNYLQNSKIIFGIVNVNNTLAFSTYSLYDIIILFNINQKIINGFSIPILIFYFFYLTFLLELLIKKFNFFYFMVLILSIASFSKLRDIGTVIPPQLLLIMLSCLIYSLFLEGADDYIFSKILLLLVFAIVLRFNSVVVAPLIIFLLFKYYKYIIPYILKNKKLIIFIISLLFLFFSKNLINSGCLVYPVEPLCFEKLPWSSNLKVTEQKYNKLSSDSKGWPFYAKENFEITDKFVWENFDKKDFYNYNTYIKQSPLFWSKYWIKDPNYKKIINLFLISIFVLFLTNIFKGGKIYVNYISKNDSIFFISSILCVVIFWFLISPQMRFSGFFCFIVLFSLVFSSLNNKLTKNISLFSIIILGIMSISYVNVKNINRIYNDINIDKFNNFPWPNKYELIEDIDYSTFIKNNVKYYKRLRTNKLVFDNGNQAILMCGNINFPCIPEGKEICLGQRIKFKSFTFYKKNKDESSCYEFMNKNILY
jgi:hypothetical protein